MAEKKENKRLKKGLGSVFGNDIDAVLQDINNNEAKNKGNSIKIKVDEIRPNPYQPRKNFKEEALKELAESIKEHGVFNPILVRKSIQGYELIAGERRLRASKLAGMKDIPAIILSFDDKGMMEVGLLENTQREDLSSIEEAKAYDALIKKLNYTQELLAQRVSKSRTYITNSLRLLKLPVQVQNMLNKGLISEGAARALINIEDKEKLLLLAERAIKEHLSVRDIERLAKEEKKPGSVKPIKLEDPYLADVRKTLEKKLKTKVEIDNKKITIHYSGTDSLNNILETIDCIEGN